MADRAVRSELLSMERLLVHTVYVRSLTRLSEIKTELQVVLKGVDCELNGISLSEYFYLKYSFIFQSTCKEPQRF